MPNFPSATHSDIFSTILSKCYNSHEQSNTLSIRLASRRIVPMARDTGSPASIGGGALSSAKPRGYKDVDGASTARLAFHRHRAMGNLIWKLPVPWLRRGESVEVSSSFSLARGGGTLRCVPYSRHACPLSAAATAAATWTIVILDCIAN